MVLDTHQVGQFVRRHQCAAAASAKQGPLLESLERVAQVDSLVQFVLGARLVPFAVELLEQAEVEPSGQPAGAGQRGASRIMCARRMGTGGG